MHRERENGRKRRYSDVKMEDLYRGPQDFMEAGVRGFLITSIPDREEHSIDETVKVLRKTCVKLYGGIKPLKREDASFAKGYIMVDFMSPENVVCLPHPDADKVVEEEKAKTAEETPKEESKDNEEMESEDKPEEETKQEEGDTEAEKDKTEGDAEKTKEEEGKEDKAKEEKEKEEKKKKEDMRRKRDEDRKPLMLAPYKFNAYRTELRNIMFLKSDIPDPVEVVNACFDMMLDRKPLYTDCVHQLLPVQGVCDNDYKQLEIMCRRVLVPYVGEHLEEAPSFGVLLINKMCEPGAEVLLEVVRSVIWCLNPNAWQCSPWAEPDVVIHIEIIGSKIILSAMPHYMKYRQYSPFAVHELGPGRSEDEELLLKEIEDNNRGDRDRGGRGGKRKDGRDGGRGKDRDDKKKPKDKDQGEKKEGGEEGSKENENTNEENKEQKEEVKEEKPKETKEEDKKDSSTEKKSSRSRSGPKSKS